MLRRRGSGSSRDRDLRCAARRRAGAVLCLSGAREAASPQRCGHGPRSCAIAATAMRLKPIASDLSDTAWRWMEERVDAQIERWGEFECWLTVFGRRFRVVSVVQGLNYRIEVDGVSHQIDRDDGGVVHAPAPAVVVSILVKPGDTVAVGRPSRCARSHEDGNAAGSPISRESPAGDGHT